jgi:hypothetical protein
MKLRVVPLPAILNNDSPEFKAAMAISPEHADALRAGAIAQVQRDSELRALKAFRDPQNPCIVSVEFERPPTEVEMAEIQAILDGRA